MRTTSLPFPLGQTYFNGETIPSDFDYAQLGFIGQEYWVKDPSVTDNRMSRVRVVRNAAATAITPDVTVDLNAEGSRVTAEDGVSTYPTEPKVDPNLADDVPVGDLCYIYIEGPGPT